MGSSAIEPKVTKGMCPRSHGHLVVRKEKNGSFISCDHFQNIGIQQK